MMVPALVTLLVCVVSPPAFDALIAEPSDQPIVIDVFTTWCKPCAQMDKNVFPDPSVMAALSQARFVRYDAERGEGVAVAERFGVASYPTVLVLAPDGTRVGQVTGQTPEDFVAQVAPLIAVAGVKGPFTDEAVAKPDVDPRVLFVFGLKTLRGPPANHVKALTLFERAAARDADGKRGVKWRATALIAATKYRIEVKALKVRTLLSLAQGDPASGATLNALGALSLYPEADAAEIHRVGDRLTQALVASKNTNALNELVYAQLAVRDTVGALASAKALEALSPDPEMMDTVAEAYFQAGQKERATAIEEEVVRTNADPELKANLQRFKTEQPSPPPFSGKNPLDELDDGAAPAGFQMPPHYAESQQLSSTLADECKAKAGKASSAWLRLTFTGAKVSRALAFDVETPAPLKKCLEEAAKKKQVKELGSHSPWTMEIVFTPN